MSNGIAPVEFPTEMATDRADKRLCEEAARRLSTRRGGIGFEVISYPDEDERVNPAVDAQARDSTGSIWIEHNQVEPVGAENAIHWHLWVPRMPSTGTTWTSGSSSWRRGWRHGVPVPLPPLRPCHSADPAFMARPGRPGDRGGHAAPRGVGPASPGRPSSVAASRPGTARRARTAAPPTPPWTVLRPAGHVAALAPRSRPPTMDLSAPPLGPSTSPRGHRRSRGPTGQGE